MIRLHELSQLLQPIEKVLRRDHPIETLVYDTRRITRTKNALFFALSGKRDGLDYVQEAYDKGIRSFVLGPNAKGLSTKYEDSNFIVVEDTLNALQVLASANRKALEKTKVIAITGSNGKTIVKEWLWEVLSLKFNTSRSPKSFNSQIGVPLSVFGLKQENEFGIIEAGISLPGEMTKLAEIIKPQIGIFTNLGQAHDSGFSNRLEKLEEKLKLFASCKVLIARSDSDWIEEIRKRLSAETELITWGKEGDIPVEWDKESQSIRVQSHEFHFQWTDDASLENISHVIVTALHFGLSNELIQQGISQVKPLEMRMKLVSGINNCFLINDAYSHDLSSFKIATEFLKAQNQRPAHSFILGDLPGNGSPEEYEELVEVINQVKPHQFIGVGKKLSKLSNKIQANKKTFFQNMEDLVNETNTSSFSNEIILIKAGRKDQFEKVVALLEEKIHGTSLELDLSALSHNLNVFQDLAPKSKIMAMVKASGYGGGIQEIANLMQYHGVDYLGVAYLNEGIELRKNGITIPIMVMNPVLEEPSRLKEFNLEPEVFDWTGLEIINRECPSLPIHINLDSGMHRLGFQPDDLDKLYQFLSDSNLNIASVFTHLSSADEDEEFTRSQMARFSNAVNKLKPILNSGTLIHACNTAGIINFPEYHFDMVRLGIGMFGIDPSGKIKERLEPCFRLTSEISQVIQLKKGEPIGYGQKGIMPESGFIATIPIGYADGYDRSLSNGQGYVWIHDRAFPVIGSVCMDMIMVYLSDRKFSIGERVEVFGENQSIETFADQQGTISYEVLTKIGPRVKRIYTSES